MNASPIPFKVCIPSRGPARIGIAASSYAHLRQIVRYKYKVSGEFFLQQEDGTIVCDEDYFRLLEPKTTLTVIESPPRPQPAFPPLQHAASTAAVVAGYQPLCPNHCWPRASVAAVGGEKKRAAVHSTIPTIAFVSVLICFYATVGCPAAFVALSPAPFANCGAGVDIWRSPTRYSPTKRIWNYGHAQYFP